MVCRAPTLNGTPKRLRNESAILRDARRQDVAIVDTGVAVRAKTFGQCIDAVRAMDVDWSAGPVAGLSDDDIAGRAPGGRSCRSSCRDLPDNPLSRTVVGRLHLLLPQQLARWTPTRPIADVRADRAEIWAGLKSPITAQQEIAERARPAAGAR